MQLNRGEGRHAAARAIRYGQRGEPRGTGRSTGRATKHSS
ncbi:transposase [Salmonella enterica subsp. enterica serovar Enteritidis]|nr:hypothetical protein [Salmonella enterica subsp. enterica serovar Newport]EBS5765070.1 hypothetical protein [Salmonella enterica subsp. enterica serovar Enteritidis]ECG6590294.1 hypothetical protein [Salmonella enterica subsp. enterica serovar Newport]EGU1063053.1 transposase [Salmonella enterica subsp. enterica serovar Enteritidis]EHF2785302.1 transposase [Salmonella enterica subsp. enterica serovar Enteritidis]